MKFSFALGLISLTIAGVSAESHGKLPVPLNTDTMGAVIKAAGSPGAASIDPTLTCDSDYVLGFNCKSSCKSSSFPPPKIPSQDMGSSIDFFHLPI